MIDKEIKTSGTITGIKYFPSLVTFDIKDKTGKIKVITFDREVDIKEDLEIQIEGTIKEYKNYLEIEAKQIRSI